MPISYNKLFHQLIELNMKKGELQKKSKHNRFNHGEISKKRNRKNRHNQ